MDPTTSEVLIDGREGEGGGQVLRTSLSLAAALGRPVTIEGVRGRRRKPGLRRQHRACLLAAREITGGTVEGDELGSARVRFVPGGPPLGGEYEFVVGSAGSTMLLLQTVLVPLLLASEPSTVVLRGGTYNPMAPPFDAIAQSFLPALRAMGAEVEIELVQTGFLPAGGGEVRVHIRPLGAPRALVLESVGEVVRRRCCIYLQGLPGAIAEREWEAFRDLLHWDRGDLEVLEGNGPGPGNVAIAHLVGEDVTATFTEFGAVGVSAQRVGKSLARAVQRHLRVGAPVDAQLADQLMLPMALLGGGMFLTGPLSRHATTNAAVIGRFLPGSVECGPPDAERRVRVAVRARAR